MPVVKFLKTVKLKIKGEDRLFLKNQVKTFSQPLAEYLAQKGYAQIFHEEVTEKCFSPFPCEIIDEDGDGSCMFIKRQLKKACLGPYKLFEDGGIQSYLQR